VGLVLSFSVAAVTKKFVVDIESVDYVQNVTMSGLI
jgi:hypothetical protein